MDAASIVRELHKFSRHAEAEQPQLHLLFNALRSHRLEGRCVHGDRCPHVRVGAVVLNESGDVLCCWHGDRWAFIEGSPIVDDFSLLAASVRVLMETTGWFEVWADDEDLGPLHIDVTEPPSGGLLFGFRYLVRANRDDVKIRPNGIAYSWRPISSIGNPHLRNALDRQHRTANSAARLVGAVKDGCTSAHEG